VRHCLEKSPAARFQSAGDVAFDLEALSGTSQSQPALAARPDRRRWIILAAVLAAVAIPAALGIVLGLRGARTVPTFQQLTFPRGTIVTARFAPDGATILYGASWNGRPFEVFSVRPESPLSRPLGFSGDVLAISSSSVLALSIGRHFVTSFDSAGTLADVALSGGAPHETLEGVEWADWAPDGRTLAIVRRVEGSDQLEFPPGTAVFRTAGWVGHPRFSPDGKRIAFLAHPSIVGDIGDVVVAEAHGRELRRSTGWSSLEGLCWSPDGKDVWFTGTRAGGNRLLWALDLSGRERLLTTAPGVLTIHDAQRDRALVSRESLRVGMIGAMADATAERDLSYLDWTAARDISADGRLLLFDENSEGGGPTGSIFVLRAGEPAPTRIGDGYSIGLSPDAKSALAIPFDQSDRRVRILPTGLGEPRSLPVHPGTLLGGDWTPDGKAILIGASDNGRPSRLYLQDVATGAIRAVTGEGVALLLYAHLISPDSKSVIARGADGALRLYPLAGGEPKPLPHVAAGEQPLRWTDDGGSLYVYTPGSVPAHVERLRLSDGKRELWKDLVPADVAGVSFIRAPVITPDGRHYVYSYLRELSELFLVRGLR
ncbi:MAG TPA: hypothetical protein VFL12_01985, partial [Thermoanaerobaculia bacterium]|nr:hypothetical protein [Thermoanaerobaculia bacterium]